MSDKSMIEKVRVRRPPAPTATPKEQAAWDAFVEFANSLEAPAGAPSPLAQSELQRLVARGNPLAIRFQAAIDRTNQRTRAADELPRDKPPARRITHLRWGKPGQSTKETTRS